LVMVAVDVRVVVEEDCATARRGRRRREVIVGRCIVMLGFNCFPRMRLLMRWRCDERSDL